jgi:hypothetical protein
MDADSINEKAANLRGRQSIGRRLLQVILRGSSRLVLLFVLCGIAASLTCSPRKMACQFGTAPCEIGIQSQWSGWWITIDWELEFMHVIGDSSFYFVQLDFPRHRPSELIPLSEQFAPLLQKQVARGAIGMSGLGMGFLSVLGLSLICAFTSHLWVTSFTFVLFWFVDGRRIVRWLRKSREPNSSN